MAHSKRSKTHSFNDPGIQDPMEKSILKYMTDHTPSSGAPLPAIEIVKGVGKKTKKEINKYLYSLEKQKLVKKVQESPPLWALVKFTQPMKSSPSSLVASARPTNTLAPHSLKPLNSSKPGSSAPVTGEPIQQHTSVPDHVKDDFEVPPTPEQLLNDICSDFSKITIKEPPLTLDKLEKRILQKLRHSNGATQQDILKDFPGNKDHEINKALENLVTTHCVIEEWGIYSLLLPPVSSSACEDASSVKTCEETCSFCDFTSDSFDISSSLGSSFWNDRPQASEPSSQTVVSVPTAQPILLPAGKNAISFLNEYAQAKRVSVPEYEEMVTGPPHKPSFWMTVTVGRRQFTGAVGASKKEAKLKAAETALAALQASNEVLRGPTNASETYDIVSHANSSVHDKVAALVNQRFNELSQMLPDTITGRKIVAGFVMSRKLPSGEDHMQVVSIGSGNRCVMGDKLSLVGTTVNDCHAEIISRRGLVRYLYKELLSNNSSVFIPSKDGSRFQLRPGIEFHLYISTAPCGDSAIFAPSDMNTDQQDQAGGDGKHHPIFENKKQGVLRTKIENGEGCIPIEEDTAAPTWDGILRGERLRTMSCSDKIAKWNYLGLQGSLLSYFLEEPIYMSSLTLGMLYNHGHLTRAICCRVQKALSDDAVNNVPYDIHHPAVSGQNHNRETGKVKTREFSLNWCLGDESPEVLDGTTGRCEERFGSTDPPRLCKAQLFVLFKQLCDRTKQSHLYQSGYFKSKTGAGSYQNAKSILWKSLEKCGFGKWMSKPKDEKDF